MQFKVPQNLDIESKLIGPLSFTQIVYVGGGLGFIFLLKLLLKNTTFAIILGGPVALLGAVLAFKKINGRPFVHFLIHFLKFYLYSKKEYAWRSEKKYAKKNK